MPSLRDAHSVGWLYYELYFDLLWGYETGNGFVSQAPIFGSANQNGIPVKALTCIRGIISN
jgi:hypothetical protein